VKTRGSERPASDSHAERVETEVTRDGVFEHQHVGGKSEASKNRNFWTYSNVSTHQKPRESRTGDWTLERGASQYTTNPLGDWDHHRRDQ